MKTTCVWVKFGGSGSHFSTPLVFQAHATCTRQRSTRPPPNPPLGYPCWGGRAHMSTYPHVLVQGIYTSFKPQNFPQFGACAHTHGYEHSFSSTICPTFAAALAGGSCRDGGWGLPSVQKGDSSTLASGTALPPFPPPSLCTLLPHNVPGN